MGWLDRIIGWVDPDAVPVAGAQNPGVNARITLDTFQGALADYLLGGAGGTNVTSRTVLRNASVARCVFLISNSIGMLPLHLMRRGDNSGEISKADDHPLYSVLANKPNAWQSAFVFRRLMQHRVLVHGNAYALVIRSRGAVRELVPLDPARITVRQRDDWSVFYEYQRPRGGVQPIDRADMLHVMGPSEDGLKGLSLVDYAGEVLGLALKAQRAAVTLFEKGVLAGGLLSTDQKLSEVAIANLKASLTQYEGAENAGKWIVGEQGMKATPFSTAKESQNVETREHQVEEIARIFGVPRPFLMVDDTSWGSGIEQLGIYFVQYALAPHFVAWEQAIEQVALTDAERRTLYPKFNERALLRGSMQAQGEFFAKALGAGGSKPWMKQDEVRGLSDLPPVGGHADELGTGAMDQTGAEE